MSNYGFIGLLRMNPDFEDKKYFPGVMEEKGRSIPKVFLYGGAEVHNREYDLNWDDDSVIISKDKYVVKYTRSNFLEILAKNESGDNVWMDCRNESFTGHCDIENLRERRKVQEHTIEEYDVVTKKKRKYKVSLVEETDFDLSDYLELSHYVDEDKLGSYFEIQDGVLHSYIGNDTELIIPEGVVKLGWEMFFKRMKFESITIPSTLIEIPYTVFEDCQTKRINVAATNPKYYTKDGCLIDKETGTLVWGYAGTTIPCDNSIRKIGSSAFLNRIDLENIVIPDNITEIGTYAFGCCGHIKYALISDAVNEIGGGAFSSCHALSLVKLPKSLTKINGSVFANCNSLESVEIPETVLTVNKFAFTNCDGLKKIDVSCDLVESIEEALNAKLIKDGDGWRVERSPSQVPKMTSPIFPVKMFSLENYNSENLPF